MIFFGFEKVVQRAGGRATRVSLAGAAPLSLSLPLQGGGDAGLQRLSQRDPSPRRKAAWKMGLSFIVPSPLEGEGQGEGGDLSTNGAFGRTTASGSRP